MSSLGNIKIPWNDFDSHLRSSMKNLRNDPSFCDVSLICEDVQVKAHKVILAASSLTFNRILHSNPHPHPLIYLKNVKMKDMINLLNYMYSGEIEVASEDAAPVLEIFREFQVKGFDPIAFTSDNSLASSTDQRVQSFPTSWINQHVLDIAIKTEDDHDVAESAATQSRTNQSILIFTGDNVGSKTAGNDCSIHADSRSSPTPSIMNQSIHSDASHPSSINQSIHTASLPSATPSTTNQSIHTDASHPSSINQSIHTASLPSATPSTTNQSIHSDASHPSSIMQASLSVREDGELGKRGSLTSARHLRSSSLSVQPGNVRSSSEPSCAEKSRKQDTSSTAKKESFSKSKGTQKLSSLNLTSAIINAIKKIKSKKKASNVERITDVVRRFHPMKSISQGNVLKQLNKAVERGLVQRIHKLGKLTYKVT